MSMSQLPTPDEEYDNIWANVKWYHVPLVAVIIIVAYPVVSALLWLTGKGDK